MSAEAPGAERETTQPVRNIPQRARERLGWRAEAALLLLPTTTVLAVFGLVNAVTNQRLLFASLASSAFLIYLDPLHAANSARTLAIAQLSAAGFGFIAASTLGYGYAAGAAAMLATIATMALLDAVHPPAVSTSLAFSLRAGPDSNLALFALAVGITAALVVMERGTVWILARLNRPRP